MSRIFMTMLAMALGAIAGSETVWGLKPLDDFFGYKPSKNGEPEKTGLSMTQITTDTGREFARKRLDEGLSNDTVNGSLRLLRRMLNIAREDNKIQVVPKVRLLKNSPARKGFLAQEQFDSLISFLPSVVSQRYANKINWLRETG